MSISAEISAQPSCSRASPISLASLMSSLVSTSSFCIDVYAVSGFSGSKQAVGPPPVRLRLDGDGGSSSAVGAQGPSSFSSSESLDSNATLISGAGGAVCTGGADAAAAAAFFVFFLFAICPSQHAGSRRRVRGCRLSVSMVVPGNQGGRAKPGWHCTYLFQRGV